MNEITNKSEMILYKTEDGEIKLEVRLEHDNMWLTQAAMAELFQTTTANINIHIKSIYAQGELDVQGTIKENLIVRKEGMRDVKRSVMFYSLQVIIAVGYRVNSIRGTQFRQWATQRLREYIVKGFVMDDERLKEGVNIGSDYFDEILERPKGRFNCAGRSAVEAEDSIRIAVCCAVADGMILTFIKNIITIC